MPVAEPTPDPGVTPPEVEATDAQREQNPGSATDPAPPALSAGDAEPSGTETPGTGHPLLWYTLARIGLLVVVAAVLYLVGARGVVWLVLAFLISGLLSFVVLGPLRDRISARLAARVDRSRAKRDRTSAAEDELL